MNDMKPIIINKQEIDNYSYQLQTSMLTVSRSAVCFNPKAVTELKLAKGSQFVFVFDNGILYLRLTKDDSLAFEINKALKGKALICAQRNIQIVLKKYNGYTSAKKHRFQIGDLKAGVYKLSFIPQEVKK